MTVVKASLGFIERVYSTAVVGSPPRGFIVGSEGDGDCTYYTVPGFDAVTVAGNPGGTTDICPHPTNGDVFFAVTGFKPVFQAPESHFNVVRRESDGTWRMHPVEKIPYLHRFDIIVRGGVLYLLAATLCSAKREIEDWSSPGEVFVAPLDSKTLRPGKRKTVLGDVTKNHGLTRTVVDGRDCFLISAETGLWKLTVPGDPMDDWAVEQWLDEPASDAAVCDIDGDGEVELAVVSPFHGDTFRILKRRDGGWETVYSREIAFGHVVWGGEINGIPSFLLGYRKLDEALLVLRSDQSGQIVETVIGTDIGPSQVSVIQETGSCSILSANRKTGKIDAEVALYTLFEDSIVV